MHELSIARAVIAVAEEQAGGQTVARVEMKVGHLRQVIPSALEFGFGLVAQGTALEGAELAIEQVPAEGVCRVCGRRTAFDGFPLSCAQCGDFDVEIVNGEQLSVESIDVIETRDSTERMQTKEV